MICSKCGSLAVLKESRQRLHEWGRMKVVAFITEYAVVDRIIDYLKLTFVADRPPPCSPHVFHEGRRLMSSSRLRSWRQLRPVLMETC
jgi:hypothetical protein